MPLTPNGKINRQGLPAPDEVGQRAEGQYVGPRTLIEEMVAGIWSEVLGLKRVSVEANFFELGGHSLLATQVISRVRETFRVEVPVRKMFERATVAGLAESIEQTMGTGQNPDALPIERLPEGSGMPLSFAQQRLWFLDQLEPGSAVYNVPATVRLKGALNVEALEESLNKIVERHENLRTIFVNAEGQAVLEILPTLALTLPLKDLSTLPEAEREAEAARLIKEEARRPFELSQAPLLRASLLRLSADEHIILLTMHHIIADGWSMGVLLREMAAFYEAFIAERPATLPELPIQYKNFAAWQRQWLRGEVLDTQLAYWKEQLADAPPVLTLPMDRPRSSVQTYSGATEPFMLSKESSEALKSLSQGAGATLFMTLLASFNLLLHLYSHQSDILLGSPIAGRSRLEAEPLIGLFLNTLVLRTHISASDSFRQLLSHLREVSLAAYAHQHLPFEKLVEELQPAREMSHTPLFQVMFIWQNAPMTVPELAGLEVRALEMGSRSTRYDLTLSMEETSEGALRGLLDYNAELFDETTIKRMVGHFETLIESIITNPEARLSDLQWLTTAETEQLVREWNETESDYPHELCLHQLFERQAELSPHAVAVVFQDEQISYAELNRKANQLAHYLQTVGVGPESLVGICIERSLEMMVGLLGILKAGGAYLPLDPHYPQERLSFMLTDADVKVLLTQDALLTSLPEHEAEVVCLDTDWQRVAEHSSDNPSSAVTAENLAYVIYTSGSTGRPKGVCISHHNLLNFLSAMQQRPGLSPSDILLAVTTLSFDIAALELFLPLSLGARVVIASREEAMDAGALMSRMEEAGASVMQATPATWRMLVEGGWSGDQALKVLCGGEALPVELAMELRERSTEVWNMYGPTETTVWSAARQVMSGEGEVWIGGAIGNTRLYVLDEQKRPVAEGVEGELYIGGEGVARGYLHRTEQTAERFVPDGLSGKAGERMYRTGDVVRREAGGSLEYVGRMDEQVKVRGYRIELGEIEAVLRGHERVQESVVVVRAGGGAGGEKQIVAYVTRAEGVEEVGVGELRRHLRERLPEYMMPGRVVEIAEMPLTPNGKINRQALPALEQSRAWVGSEYVAPRTPVEEVIATIWADVLGLERVGIEDNFFELGGHSLLATQLVFRLQSAFEVDLPLRSIFEMPTVAQLAEHVAQVNAVEPGRENSLAQLPSIVPAPGERHEPFPLTDVQQAYWVGRSGTFELGNVATHVYVEFESEGLDVEELNRAFQRLIERHEMLRAIVLPDGQQQILEEAPVYRIETVDLRGHDSEAVVSALEAVRGQMSHQVLRADHWPLFELRASLLDGGRTRLHISFDLLIGDARSFQILTHELNQVYRNPSMMLDAFDLSFRDYVLAEARLQDSELYQRSLSYWQERLTGLPPAPDLPLAVQPGLLTKSIFVRREGELDSASWLRLKKRAARAGLTPSSILLTAFADVLSVWSKGPRFTINLTLFNRLPLHPQVNDIVGDFTSLTLLEVDNSAIETFEARARRLQGQLWNDLDHRYVSGVKVLRELARTQNARAGATMPVVFTSMLNLAAPESQERDETGKHDGWTTAAFGEQVYGISQTPQVWLDHQAFEREGALGFNWDAVDELFPEGLLGEMFDAYCRHLRELAHEDSEAWQETGPPQLLPQEQLEQRALINATASPLNSELLHTMFIEQARHREEQLAVVSSTRTLTYGELLSLSNRLGRRLRNFGARPNTLVAVVMDKGWEQVAAVLGTLQSGAAYLPIDAGLPRERLWHLLERGEVSLVLTQTWLDANLEWPESVRRICVDDDDEELAGENDELLEAVQGPLDLAYVIFTSGSTGQPKGVMIDHRGAVNTIIDINERFAVQPEDRVLALSSLSFDLSVYDIFGMLSAGGTIVMPDANARRDPQHWAEMMRREKVTIWNSVPALMDILLEHVRDRDERLPEHLRLAMLSGDWVPLNLPDGIRARGEGVSVFSLGGATEASIWSILYPIEEVNPNWKSIPYGKPMRNQSWQVLNEWLEPCPVWTTGQLYIGGVGLAQGYWRDEEKTARSFITHPRTGARLYRTGDLGRYLPDGNIEFLGREDSQVKIQGYRIELGEIETTLEQHAAVRAAVVAATGAERSNKRLVAYVVPAQDYSPGVDELQDYLKEKLPDYLVPSLFMFLDTLPLSPNGKVDRRALPEHEYARSADTLAAPGNQKEHALVEIWSRVLGLETVGVQDNFFELGGDSILSIRAAAKASERGLRLTPDQIFQYRTIAELAAVVGTTEGVRAEQGLITGPVPLTPIQRWFFEQEFRDPHHWNQAVLLEVRQRLDHSLLKKSVRHVLMQHDALRLRFVRDDVDGWRQSNSVSGESQVEALDLSALREEAQAAAIEEAASAAQASLNLSDGPLMRAIIFDLGEDVASRLFIVIHHLVVDGVSWRILLDDLERAYQQLGRGEKVMLPPKSTSYKQWSEKLRERVREQGLDQEITYWLAMSQASVHPLPVDDIEGRTRNTVASARTFKLKLDQDETGALLHDVPEIYHTQINDVLLTALAEGFKRWSGTRRLLIDLETHGREAIVDAVDLSRTIGWFTAIHPVLLEAGNVWEPGTELKKIKEHLRAIPNWGIGYGLLKYLSDDAEIAAQLRALKPAEVSFNYLGQFDQVISDSSLYAPARESIGALYGPTGNRTHLLAVYGSIAGGQFQLDLEYSSHAHRPQTIERLAESFMKALREIIAHCASPEAGSYTPSDFPLAQLGQEELDAAFRLIELED
jgi:amino acid adenylation domain-containing protein/non-ribosomal peptide synthase protein (TIGR01720 family)